ncbi:MAG: CHASE2 domain-containing protein [Candidatus Dormiibacterota bacterium]
MVRERVGDWRSIWRFALAGLQASLLVVATSQTTVVAPLFFALQDQLFPSPPPSSQVTLVALDSVSARQFGPFPFGSDMHAKVINYLASLHPTVILFDVMLDHPSSNPETDSQLAAAIAGAGNVVLICTADDSPLRLFANAAASVAGRKLGVPDAANAVRGVPIRPSPTCPENKSGEPAFVQALRIAEGITDPMAISGSEAQLGPHHIPFVLSGQQEAVHGPQPELRLVGVHQLQAHDHDVVGDQRWNLDSGRDRPAGSHRWGWRRW